MLTAFRGRDDDYFVAFVAAATIDEFKGIQENLIRDGWFEPDIMDFFTGRLKGFGMGCVFTASSETEIDQVIAKYSMRVMSRDGAMQEHMAMRSKQPKDPLFSDTRPLYEILGVDMGDDAPTNGQSTAVVGTSFGDVPTENVKEEVTLVGQQTISGKPDYLEGKPFRKFYRLDIHGMNVDDLLMTVQNKGSLLCSGQDNDTAWVGFPIERLAMSALDDVGEIFPEISWEIYAMDRYGERLVTAVVKPAPKLKRPWAGDTISEKEIKSITTDEFVFAGYPAVETANRSTIFFTPKDVFEKTNEMWDGDVGPYIEHLLSPRIFQKRTANVYWVMINDHERVLQLLTGAGFVESLAFQAWVNSR